MGAFNYERVPTTLQLNRVERIDQRTSVSAQQIIEAFPWEDPPKYLLRDRDKIYGKLFQSRVTGMGFEEVIIAARSSWRNPFVERIIGSIWRECLDHVIVLNEMHLRRILRSYFRYYHEWRGTSGVRDGLP